MAQILHTFLVNDPNNVGAWPPSIQASDWITELGAYASAHAWASNSHGNLTVYLWDSEADLNNYLSAHRLTDPTLLADLDAWKAAHGVSFTSAYYNLTPSSTTPPDIVS